jgi:hypothetical protein
MLPSCIVDDFLQFCSDGVLDPISAALGAYRRGNIPYNDYAESQVNGKSSFSRFFIATAERAKRR